MTALDFLVNACLNKEQQCSFCVSLFNSSYKWKEKNPNNPQSKKDIKYFIGHHIFLSVLWPEGTERPKSAPYCQQYFKIQLSGDINILSGTASVFYKQLKEEKSQDRNQLTEFDIMGGGVVEYESRFTC